MKRFFLGILLGCSLLMGSFTLVSCNTVAGMGHDSQETINAFQVGPRDAYHQDARDF